MPWPKPAGPLKRNLPMTAGKPLKGMVSEAASDIAALTGMSIIADKALLPSKTFN